MPLRATRAASFSLERSATRVRSAAGTSASDDGESWNYGVGGQYFFDDKNGVRADYTRHDFKDSSTDANTWSVSYVRKF